MKDVKVKTDPKMREASEGGQKPPTDATAVRQHYQLATQGGESERGRAPKSRQFNRGSSRGRSKGGY